MGGAAAGSDTLVVRRAADDRPVSLEADRIYVQTSRLEGALFVAAATCLSATDPACIPALYWPLTSQSRELVVHGYYVSQQSTQRADVPALRRKSFGNVNAGAVANAITDEEIVAGVEDLQVRFGVDSDGDANVDMLRRPRLRSRGSQRDVGNCSGCVSAPKSARSASSMASSYQYADMPAPAHSQ